MKKWIALVLCALMALSAFSALAVERGDFIGDMRVVNCKQWVSLRKKADKASDRLASVPLDSLVTHCQYYNKYFTLCEFDGKKGYILNDYLKPCADKLAMETLTPMRWEEMNIESGKNEVLYEAEGLTILSKHHYPNDGEQALVAAFADEETPLWSWLTQVPSPTELEQTAVFMGGTLSNPKVMLYNSQIGLRALNPLTGEEEWFLPVETIHLGASITVAADDFGTMYIAGFYGPDPVAVSADGEVLWTIELEEEDIYWPYDIRLTENGLLVKYDSLSQKADSGYYEVFITFGGTVQWVAIRG